VPSAAISVAQVISLTHYLWLATLLFLLGVVGITTRRNALMMLLAIELMLNAANLSFVAWSRFLGDLTGQVFVFFIITVAAAEVTVGLAIVLLLFRNVKTLDAHDVNFLKW